MDTAADIRWQPNEVERCTVLQPRGPLDAVTYRRFTAELVKYVVEQPRAVVVCLDELTVPSETALTAFTSARLRTADWPAVPIVLVARGDALRQRLVRSAIRRFLPIHASVPAAVAALAEPPLRRRVDLTMALTADAGPRVRRFVDEVCTDWAIAGTSGDAQVVATEFVENAYQHGIFAETADIDVRLEYRNDLLTVAVADPDPHEAVLLETEPEPSGRRTHGLHMVAGLAAAWGCAPRWPSGKIVWATLPTARPRQLG